MPEPQSKLNSEAEQSEETDVSSLGVLGVVLMIIGTCILGWHFFTSPEVIAYKNVDPAFTDGLESYGFEREMLRASWALFLAPIIIITGAIFTAAGCVVAAIGKR
jgi:hypothetical protein